MIRLICLGMGGVLARKRMFWVELHRRYGTFEEGTALEEKHRGDDYTKLIEHVVRSLWRGKSSEPYLALIDDTVFMPGLEEFFRALPDAPRAIMTEGPYELAERLKDRYGIDFIFANRLVFRGGKVAGAQWPVLPGEKKVLVEQLCDDLDILPQHVLHVGSDESDLDSFRIVGTSIAFNSESDRLREEATHVVNADNLKALIPLLGQHA